MVGPIILLRAYCLAFLHCSAINIKKIEFSFKNNKLRRLIPMHIKE